MSKMMKPMLAVNLEGEPRVPCFVSPKIDGIRCFNDGGVALTRSRLPQPNDVIRAALSAPEFHGLDGELVCGDVNDPAVFQKSSGALRSIKTDPVNWSWHIFDDFSAPQLPFVERMAGLEVRVAAANALLGEERLFIVSQCLVKTAEEFDLYEHYQVHRGFEGIIRKAVDGPYKYGRATAKEGFMEKVKRMSHDEAVVEECIELMHNGNEAFVGELGQTKRASNAENLVNSGMLGAFRCRAAGWSETFKVSCSSMTQEEKIAFWEGRESLIGRTIRFEHFSHGAKDRPRQGVYAGFRDAWDLG